MNAKINDIEAEQAVIGSLLYQNDLFSEVATILQPESFSEVSHQHIFRAVLELEEEETPFDDVIVADKLHSKGVLNASGGRAYLVELIDYVPSSGNVVYYAEIVKNDYDLREAAKKSQEIANRASQNGAKPSEIAAELQGVVDKITESNSDKSLTGIQEALKTSFERLEVISQNDSDITGLASGFTDLDKITAGFQNKDLIILAARASMGKTACALNIAVSSAKQKKGDIIVFSLEMASEQLAIRMLSSEAKIDSSKLMRGNLDGDDWDRLAMATDELSTLGIELNDTPSISPMQLSGICKAHSKKKDIALVIVDYLQLMRGNKQTSSREQEISEISRSLKALAKDLNCPVIALSQLNRNLESRKDRRPMMSDLRESGAIEQDADIVMFIYRDEVYNEDSPDKGIAELILGKHRNGATGTVKLSFTGKYTKFGNLAEHRKQYS